MALAMTAGLLMMMLFAGAARAEFDISAFDGQWSANAAGDAFTQAGGHPYAITTEIEFNRHPDPEFEGPFNLTPDAPARDVIVDLPPGVVGNSHSADQCTVGQLLNTNNVEPQSGWCPLASQVGRVTLNDAGLQFTVPLFNMVPPLSTPAQFAFNFAGVLVSLDSHVRSDGDYGVSVLSSGISEGLPVVGVGVTIWGVPADAVHDQDRCYALHIGASGPNCTGEPGDKRNGPNPADRPVVPFLTLPTRCTAPGVGLETKVRADSWHQPGVFQEAGYLSHEPPNFPAAIGERGGQVGVNGCGAVPFAPLFQVQPSSHAADAPTGLSTVLTIPQDGLESTERVASSALRKLVVALPEGMAINPSVADGLGSCSSAQIDLGGTQDPSCPDSSKIGTVTIDTPLLADPIVGSVYVASPGDNPFGTLLAAYVVAKAHGVVLKVPGKIEADPVSGHLTASFDELPQLPFAKLTLQLKSGPRAPLATPAGCGSVTASSQLAGWNGKTVSLSNPVNIDCAPGLGGFNPSFNAGTTNPQAAAFSPLTLTFSRQDGEQQLSNLTVKTPAGLLGILKNVTQCPEPQAAQGTCSEASLIGHVTTGAGAGPNPLLVAGKAFLTGPYAGAPFGLSVVVPAVAGPFNLGTVVVRSRIAVDPHTAQLTVTSDPFPTILQGIPLHLRTVNVTIDRPAFIFNPTNCEPLSMTGTITSTQGTTANVSSHFQAANCAALPFKPSFKVSTKATTTKKNGASLDVKVTSGAGQANLGKVAVTLPKQLPSWLPTIQQACLAAVFNANPAGCPAGSNIGVATATTPILANPVTGPVYLVSHGGAAFPDIVMVLQGEGVTVEQTGSINIKGQVTSSAFNSIPDVPLNTFELNLPQGPHHALSSNLPAKAKGSFCGQTLTMPTTLTGQNGAQIKQSTKITVTGCPKAKKAKKHKAKKRVKARKGSLRGGR